MEIQLHKSWYLLIFRFCLLTLALAAIAVSELGSFWTFIAYTAGFFNVRALLTVNDPVCRFSFSNEHTPGDVAAEQKIVVELKSSRRIEFTVGSFYCLWWLQILYLSSSRESVVLVLLPDNCSAEARRCLRLFLNHGN